MVSKTSLSILVSIVLTIILVSLVNVGTSLVFNSPDYSDYCGEDRYPMPFDRNITQEECEDRNGTWFPQDERCDLYTKCNNEYNEARDSFNQQRFYVFALIGFVLLVAGLFAKENLVQITGLATGGILVFQSVIFNLQNQIAVFLTLLGILVVFGVLAYRIINSKK